MRLLFDQNLSHLLVKLLLEEFPGSVHVRDLGLAAAADTVVWQYAMENGFINQRTPNLRQQRAEFLWYMETVRLGFQRVAGHSVGPRTAAAADRVVFADTALPLETARRAKAEKDD